MKYFKSRQENAFRLLFCFHKQQNHVDHTDDEDDSHDCDDACNYDFVDDEDYGDKHDMDGEVSEDDNNYGLRNMPIIAL